jgi:aryl-alcohol dehydrogenase-like predicted oxidoreductase
MNKRKLREFEVSEIGLGCMGMSEFYGATDEEQSTTTIRRALDIGVTFLDTSDMYGSGHNEQLMARAIEGRRDEVQLATKFAIRRDDSGNRSIDNRPEWIHEACDASLRRLGVDHIDLYYMHRRDPRVPIEESVGAMGELVEAGKVRYLGLSEVNADTLRAADATHPITALQSEWSLFTRGLEDEIVPTARELGVGIVAYSPLGRGELSGKLEIEGPGDFRADLPRFQDENREHNLELLAEVREVADQVGCSTVQLALAWLLHQGDDVVPIPGTKRTEYLEENAAAAEVELTREQLATLDAALPAGAVAGERYPAGSMQTVER